jgi:hypothetical protein
MLNFRRMLGLSSWAGGCSECEKSMPAQKVAQKFDNAVPIHGRARAKPQRRNASSGVLSV